MSDPAFKVKRSAVIGRWLLAATLLLSPLDARAAPVVQVLVNPAQGAFPLDHEFLWAIFTDRIRVWPDGTPIHVFVLPDTDKLTDLFDRSVLGTYPYVLRVVWDRMAFTGTGQPPTVVRSEQEMRQRIMSTSGAIGYVGNTAALPPASDSWPTDMLLPPGFQKERSSL